MLHLRSCAGGALLLSWTLEHADKVATSRTATTTPSHERE
jgi:hypothetical protein